MIRFIRLFKQYLAVVCLLLLTVYYVNSTMFWHSHIINGTCVQHSHMHVQHHHNSLDGGHTTPQLLLIQMLQEAFQYLGTSFILILVSPILLQLHTYRRLVQSCRLGYVHHRYLRAPPFCVFS